MERTLKGNPTAKGKRGKKAANDKKAEKKMTPKKRRLEPERQPVDILEEQLMKCKTALGAMETAMGDIKKRHQEVCSEKPVIDGDEDLPAEVQSARRTRGPEQVIHDLREQLAACEKTIADHEKTMNELKRHSSIAPRKVAGIEDVNSKNRPTQVADAYTNLMNYQWLDALLELSAYEEEQRFEKLMMIMTTAWQEANAYLEVTEKRLVSLIKDPFSQPDFKEGINPRERTGSVLPPAVMSQAIDITKEQCEKHNTEVLLQNTLTKIKKSLPESGSCKEIRDYVGQCCRVAWRMVVQQPRMTLTSPTERLGRAIDPLKEDLYADSKPRGTISSYVKAGVVQDDKYFVKALVCLK